MSFPIDVDNSCGKCKKKCNSNNISTIIKDKEKYVNIKFCDIDCMSKFDFIF